MHQIGVPRGSAPGGGIGGQAPDRRAPRAHGGGAGKTPRTRTNADARRRRIAGLVDRYAREWDADERGRTRMGDRRIGAWPVATPTRRMRSAPTFVASMKPRQSMGTHPSHHASARLPRHAAWACMAAFPHRNASNRGSKGPRPWRGCRGPGPRPARAASAWPCEWDADERGRTRMGDRRIGATAPRAASAWPCEWDADARGRTRMRIAGLMRPRSDRRACTRGDGNGVSVGRVARPA
jgi:hypothetical protein